MPADSFSAAESFYAAENVTRTPIQEFFSGKTIFITGGTGFVGKLLIEKLIHTCPDIKKIYFLVRSKKGKDARSRIEDLCNDPLFSSLKRDVGPIEKYLQGISGDCEQRGLGICEEDSRLLENEIDVVFHAAATVRFDEVLKKAISTNVKATKSMVDLMKRMKNLKAAVHVSTAYSHCNRKEIDEQFYPAGISAEDALALPDDIDVDVDSLLGTWPNTYSFTKAIAEEVVKNYAAGLPIAIFRPSIITGTTADGPLTGWIDNQYGPTGMIIGVGVGLIRTIEIDMLKVADIVPGDMCVNAMMACAWDASKRTSPEVPIFNFVSSARNPITWGAFMHNCLDYGRTIPPAKGIWCMAFNPTKVHLYYLLLRIFLHTIPAFFMDIFLAAAGNKLRMKRVYRTLHKFSKVLTYFTTNEWTFGEANTVRLLGDLSEQDRKIFPFDLSLLHWPTYLRDICDGARIYICGEDVSTLPHARTKYTRFLIAHNTLKIVFVALLAWFCYSALFKFLNFFDLSFQDSIRRIEPHLISTY